MYHEGCPACPERVVGEDFTLQFSANSTHQSLVGGVAIPLLTLYTTSGTRQRINVAASPMHKHHTLRLRSTSHSVSSFSVPWHSAAKPAEGNNTPMSLGGHDVYPLCKPHPRRSHVRIWRTPFAFHCGDTVVQYIYISGCRFCGVSRYDGTGEDTPSPRHVTRSP
jgi:hypothetical protein